VVLGVGGSNPLAHPSESCPDQRFYRMASGARRAGRRWVGPPAAIAARGQARWAAV